LEQYHFDALPYAYMVGVMAGAWLVGRVIRRDLRDALALRDRTQVLRAQRDRLCELAVSGQRRDVAREMHDVVGHGLSLITVQAGVVDALAPRHPARALEALSVVEGAARSTRGELAALQAALSGPAGADTTAEAADPALNRWAAVLERIVDEARAVGQPVLAWIDPRLDELDPAAGGAVVRIAQEALTNVRKHAGGAATTLEATVRGGEVELSVANESGGGLAGTPVGSGLGIAGMADRAAALGGTVDAGAIDRAAWAVRARIPVAAARQVSV
jgi:signal transduction histidine kinase